MPYDQRVDPIGVDTPNNVAPRESEPLSEGQRLVAVFESASHAEGAYHRVLQHGVPHQYAHTVHYNEDLEAGARPEQFFEQANVSLSSTDYDHLATALNEGAALLVIHGTGEHTETAVQALENHPELNQEGVITRWRNAGWNRKLPPAQEKDPPEVDTDLALESLLMHGAPPATRPARHVTEHGPAEKSLIEGPAAITGILAIIDFRNS